MSKSGQKSLNGAEGKHRLLEAYVGHNLGWGDLTAASPWEVSTANSHLSTQTEPVDLGASLRQRLMGAASHFSAPVWANRRHGHGTGAPLHDTVVTKAPGALYSLHTHVGHRLH